MRLTDFSDRKKRTNKFTKLDVFQTKQCVQQCLMKILVEVFMKIRVCLVKHLVENTYITLIEMLSKNTCI
ncbi:hypothetical protein DT132_12165 [Salmonella enterica subsp. enterica serovar Heidelberg]|nr:hypothetical protein [Salmonella enterica subsp. enterica serovar Heidelberg]EFE7864626.1 hypothetical protein [Escherichia coli]MBG8791173.1 hypothetical protein [Salmonella enterica subsp. enterica]EBX9295337.1 hypothetical protein [Salmonella enterica subsp. enterica serovar Heidelberg]EBX9575546.1 hypothetical protein [Salmonella enterica subsp. enterica serovar Heidelberg]